jgi:hypothetical protein
LERVFTTPPDVSSKLSLTEYALPNGNYLSIWLNAVGQLWQQDNSSLATAQVGTLAITPGSQFRSVTAFDKQWFAFFYPTETAVFTDSPFVGCDVPRYYDGQNVWRVTQDAPAITPVVTDFAQALTVITATNAPPTFSISAATQATGYSGTCDTDSTGLLVTYVSGVAFSAAMVGQPISIAGLESIVLAVTGTNTLTLATAVEPSLTGASYFISGSGVVTLATTLPHGFIPGQVVWVYNVPIAGYNGLQTIQTVPSTTQLTYTVDTNNLAASSGGMVGAAIAEIETNVTSTVQPSINIGDTVVLYGSGSGLDNNIDGNPATWLVTNVFYAFGHWTIEISFATAPSNILITPTTTGTVALGGQSTAGVHNVVCMFVSVNGAITAPSVPLSFLTVGNTQWTVTGIPIGPPGTQQRILAFTLDDGASYFYLGPSVVPATALTPTVVNQGTIIDNNTATSATIDVSDAALEAGIEIDIQGNDLFNQVVLAPCLGCIEYEGRMAWWGEINDIKNLINNHFDGGYLTTPAPPPGWTCSSGVKLVNQTDQSLGFACQMTSTGAAVYIEQPCYQDYYGAPIVQPNIPYTFRCLAQSSGAGAGVLTVAIVSPSVGNLAVSAISLAPSSAQRWITLNLSTLPSNIPSDAIFKITLTSSGGTTVLTLDEIEMINSLQPVLFQQMRVSYFDNEFGYDEVTGILGLDGSAKITAAFKQRSYLYALTDGPLFQTQNNGQTEPSGWSFPAFADESDCFGPNAVTTTEDIAWWAGLAGFRVFNGAQPKKLSQEIQPDWETINQFSPTAVWAVNDPIGRLVYIGVPVGGSTLANLMLPMSYRSVDAAYNVPDPLHTSYSGRMIATDLCRKWTRWNLPMNCCAILTRPGLQKQPFFGGPQRGFDGNLYSLNFTKYTDDDFGVISSYYTTYFFFNHDTEQNAPGLGLHQKINRYLTAYITGVGQIQPTALVNNLNNPWQTTETVWDPVNQIWGTSGSPNNPIPAYPLTNGVLLNDLEWGLNINSGARMAIKWSVLPLNGQTDAAFQLTHMVMSSSEAIIPVRGAL